MNAVIQNIKPDVVTQFSRAKKAEIAVDQLSLEGYDVIAVDLNNKAPVIWIEHTDDCPNLQAVMVGSTPISNGKLKVFAAPYGCCQVRWHDVVN